MTLEHLVNLDTFIRGGTPSQIDHILTSDDDELVLRGFGCGTGAVWHLYNDHVPLWAEFNIARGGLRPLVGPREKQPRQHTPLVTPNIYKEEDVEKFGEKMLELLTSLPECVDTAHAGELLEKICRESVTVARAVKPPIKKNKFYHDGWSPIFFVLRARMIYMINIRRGLCGYKHVFWKEEDRTRNICVLIDRWRAVVDRFTFESEERKLEIMSWSASLHNSGVSLKESKVQCCSTRSAMTSYTYKTRSRAGSVLSSEDWSRTTRGCGSGTSKRA